ncbi:MAG: transketolase [Chitinophagales bacterium]|nr:MAG: transketolase [Chitinophagales bacterium]
MTTGKEQKTRDRLSFQQFRKTVLHDYQLAVKSREVSLLSRKEVLTGKAKFGILGDGKEVPQIALAKTFRKGDYRAGYYRDQTLMFALGEVTVEQYFAQLYANPDKKEDPHSAGRQMNAHFATKFIDEKGEWLRLTERYNSSADGSSTGHQMPRALGLALASKLYRLNTQFKDDRFSINGDEVVFCTIGDASTSEGIFWEALNAAGVMRVPLAISIWDDGYGISVPRELQTTKGSISEVLQGFQTNEKGEGIDIYVVKGWDYPALCEVYEKGIAKVRSTHIPAVFHITELTQPQGHSTSGSHERYKSKERLAWEREYDCIKKMREWIIENAIATSDELDILEEQTRQAVIESRNEAWKRFLDPILRQAYAVADILDDMVAESTRASQLLSVKEELLSIKAPLRRDVMRSVKQALRITRQEYTPARLRLVEKKNELEREGYRYYRTYLYSQSKYSALHVEEIKPQYDDDAPRINGYEILNHCFDKNLERYPQLVAFGEDVGKIGDVNQAFAGLQKKYGELRVFDTGIREATIIGQGIGLAMRGFRPIAEIQYLDYLIFGLQPLTDDVATLHYRSAGNQKCPLIVRTRGHRLEGIWHAGSPMGMLLHSLRGMYILVPRDMTRAAGFYNTMLRSDDPALIIECLNGYRLKETLPRNIADFTVPLGVPEVLKEGDDVTVVTYGSCVRVAQEALYMLENAGISCELIDVQTLLPFDRYHKIVESIKKTNKVLFLDEDVPGGATSFMLQQVMEVQKAYYWLDSEPRTLTAAANRPAYGSDGDYFCKPSADDVFDAVYAIMHEYNPQKYPALY